MTTPSKRSMERARLIPMGYEGGIQGHTENVEAIALAFDRLVEEACEVAKHQATICGGSLSRQSTALDIEKNIRLKLKGGEDEH